MAETMVRTQVYLPRDVYEKLRQRAEKHKLTLALQIRAALELCAETGRMLNALLGRLRGTPAT